MPGRRSKTALVSIGSADDGEELCRKNGGIDCVSIENDFALGLIAGDGREVIGISRSQPLTQPAASIAVTHNYPDRD
jgi:hypothetical protein